MKIDCRSIASQLGNRISVLAFVATYSSSGRFDWTSRAEVVSPTARALLAVALAAWLAMTAMAEIPADRMRLIDEALPATAPVVAKEIRRVLIFNTPYSRDTSRVLLSLDTHGTNMDVPWVRRDDNDFALAWTRLVGKGREFYCAIGHHTELYWNPAILQFYLSGVQFCTGDLEADGNVRLPPLPAKAIAPPTDWLIDPSPYKAGVYRSQRSDEVVLDNGLVRRTFRVAPNAATVGLDNLMTGAAIVRGVKPEAIVSIDGVSCEVGGLSGQSDYAYLRQEWLDQMTSNPEAFQFAGYHVGRPAERLVWKRVRRHTPDAKWPPAGVYLRMDFDAPAALSQKANSTQTSKQSGEKTRARAEPLPKKAEAGAIRVSVHYELYDGLPVMSKWITVHNSTDRKITVDRFTSEILAVVEHSNWVETREGVPLPRPQSLHVETDMAFGGFQPANANRHVVHWRSDPQFHTQVNYLRQTPCLLAVEPVYGPAQDVEPGGTFESFRAFELVYDATDRERMGLSLRRMYRVIAPWVTENPLMMHMRTADPAAVRQAIDQCAEVGFEMLILSFGSGFNIENDRPEYISCAKIWPITPGRKASRSAATRCWPPEVSAAATTSYRQPACPQRLATRLH